MVDPADDLAHVQEGAHQRWRESYYFSFYDFERGLGIYSTIDHRPARHESGSVNVLWGESRSTLVTWEREHLDPRRAHSIGGLLYRPHEPFGSWWWAFSGKLNDGGSELQCDNGAIRSAVESGNPSIGVDYDLTFIPDQPVYEYPRDPAWEGHFEGHVEEVGGVTGRLRIEDEEMEIDARASKEHSWGVRDWGRRGALERIELVIDGGPQAKLRRTTVDDSRVWVLDGAVFGSGRTDRVASYEGPGVAADPGAEHEFLIEAESMRIQARAQVVRRIPLRFKARDSEGRPVSITNDRTNFRCVTEQGQTAIGSVEERRRLS